MGHHSDPVVFKISKTIRSSRLHFHFGLLFEVREGKTVNAQRIAPVSPAVRPLVLKVIDRVGSSPWLFPEIGEAVIGAEKAVNSISSKFGKITKGFTKVEGFKTGLHSFRGHFATALEQVGCPEEIATKLAGHKQLSLTYNLYSKYKNRTNYGSILRGFTRLAA